MSQIQNKGRTVTLTKTGYQVWTKCHKERWSLVAFETSLIRLLAIRHDLISAGRVTMVLPKGVWPDELQKLYKSMT